MTFQEALMEALKARYIEVIGEREFGGVESKTQAAYYLKCLEDNLVVPMNEQHVAEYSRGSGGELDGKMKALRSSSAMTFNLLGNGPVELNGTNALPKGMYAVEFEYQLPTLAGNPNPANLDAKLASKNGDAAIFCEMKLAEWIFNKASWLRAQYLHSDNYLIPDRDAAVFCRVFEQLCAIDSISEERIAPRLSRYDAFQMLKHLLAIYTDTVCKSKAGEHIPQQIVLLNCVWEMAHPEKLGGYETMYRSCEAEEHEQFHEFSNTVQPISELFVGLGVDFALRYIPFADMRDSLNLDAAHRYSLERYIV